jgi:adenylate cyclase
VHHLPFPHEDLPEWLTNVDYRLMVVIAGLTIVVGDTIWRNHRRPAPGGAEVSVPGIADQSLSNRTSIAVLPFLNMSGDIEQDYFADGMTEEIITELSHVHWMFVIARNSSFTYKGKATDVREIARDLGVRYVLEGSVRKAADTIRITAQLIETGTGAHVWADRFNGPLADVFALQDEVTDNIVRAIAPTVRNAEIDRTRRKAPANMDAYDHYLQALPHYYAMSREGSDEGLRLLDRSLALEPRFALALALKAQVLAWREVMGLTQPVASRHPEILRLARDSVQSDPNDPDIVAGAAHLLAWAGGEYEESAQLATRARAIGTNSAFVWMQIGQAQFHSGHWQDSVDCLEKALQLDPIDPIAFSTRSCLAQAYVALGQDATAIAIASRAIQQNPNFGWAWRIKAAACALSGDLEGGHDALNNLLRLQPIWNISVTFARAPGACTPANYKRLIEGIRLLGAPEQ